jgi:hypothetical protein
MDLLENFGINLSINNLPEDKFFRTGGGGQEYDHRGS